MEGPGDEIPSTEPQIEAPELLSPMFSRFSSPKAKSYTFDGSRPVFEPEAKAEAAANTRRTSIIEASLEDSSPPPKAVDFQIVGNNVDVDHVYDRMICIPKHAKLMLQYAGRFHGELLNIAFYWQLDKERIKMIARSCSE